MGLGYNQNGTLQLGWWKEQIEFARKYRKEAARTPRWDDWRAYYRGDYEPGTLPKNLFYSTLRSIVPRVYFRDPKVSVRPKRPGTLEMLFAQTQGRLDNTLLDVMRMKREMRRQIHNTLLFGVSFGKLGYGGQYKPVSEAGDTEPSAEGKRPNHRLEWRDRVFANLPWYQSVHPQHILVPFNVDCWANARFVVHELERPEEMVRADPHFKAGARRLVKGTFVDDERHNLGGSAASVLDPDSTEIVNNVRLLEVSDRAAGRVFVIAENQEEKSTVLLDQEAPWLERGFRIFPLQFNPDDEYFWGPSDAKIWEPHQREVVESRTQMMKHRRAAVVKLLVRKGAIDQTNAEAIVDEDVAPVLWTEGPPEGAVVRFQAGDIPQDLFMHDQLVAQDFREISGLSRNQVGEFQNRRGDTSAAEARIVEGASEVRLDERRDQIADMMVDVVEALHEMVYQEWNEERIQEVVGPGGAQVWVRFRPSELSLTDYSVKVDPDSLSPLTRELRQQEALQIYTILKDNPLVDPERLTRFLLTEAGRVEVDDLMRILPPQPTPGGPLSLQQFGGVVDNALQAGPTNPEALLASLASR